MRGVWPEVAGIAFAASVLAVLLALALYVAFLPFASIEMVGADEAISVGIIGGVDGPTSIYVTTNNTAWLFGLAVAGLLALVAVIVLLRRIVRKCAGRKLTGN